MKILLVDSDEITRCGLRSVLQPLRNTTICGESSNGLEGIRKAHELKPDIVISEFRLPGANGIILTRRILKAHPEQRVLIFSCIESQSEVRRLLLAGIHGLVSKADPISELINALEAVGNDRTYFGTGLLKAMISEFLQPILAPVSAYASRLTLREYEIAQLLAEGKVTKEVATILDITLKTAATHRTTIMRKLGAHNLAQLTRNALSAGIIDVPRFTPGPKVIVGGKPQFVTGENAAKAAA